MASASGARRPRVLWVSWRMRPPPYTSVTWEITGHRSEIEGQVGGKSTRGHEIEHDMQVYLANLGTIRGGREGEAEKRKGRRGGGMEPGTHGSGSSMIPPVSACPHT